VNFLLDVQSETCYRCLDLVHERPEPKPLELFLRTIEVLFMDYPGHRGDAETSDFKMGRNSAGISAEGLMSGKSRAKRS
jgi:hypothetical protein